MIPLAHLTTLDVGLGLGLFLLGLLVGALLHARFAGRAREEAR